MRRALLPILAAALLVVWSAQLALGAKPDRIVIEVDETEIIEDLCEFPITHTITGRVQEKTFVDREGELVRELANIALRRTLSTEWASVRFVDTGVDRTIFHADGSFTVHVIGNIGKVTLPGQGPVFGAAGQFIFRLTPVGEDEFDVEFIAFHGLEPDNLEALCAFLGPPS
jgi:hypothetical protein